jgi:AAA domain
MAGLPGTGKTTLARELAGRTSGRILSKDEIRHAIFSAAEMEYSSRQDDFCVQIMLETAAYLLRQDPARIVFLDGRSPASIRLRMFLPLPLLCTSPGGYWNAFARKRRRGVGWSSTPGVESTPQPTATFSSILMCDRASKRFRCRRPLSILMSCSKSAWRRLLPRCGECFAIMPTFSDGAAYTIGGLPGTTANFL